VVRKSFEHPPWAVHGFEASGFAGGDSLFFVRDTKQIPQHRAAGAGLKLVFDQVGSIVTVNHILFIPLSRGAFGEVHSLLESG
jgi:hypothetical protein